MRDEGNLGMKKFIKISLVLISLTAQIAPAFANPPSAEQLAEWRAAAEQRNQARTQVMRQVQGNNNWHEAETIMNRDTTVRYLESINRLERRYPGAVPQAEQNYREAFSQLHHLKVDGKGASADLKKDAAFRYFDQPKVQDSIGSGLNNRQVLSLAWAAVQDKSIFSTRLEREDRKWGLLESLANIQRAHNDCLAGGAIEWRQTHQADHPSCEVGKFKRLLEHLDQLHPDVQLSPPLREDRAPSPQIMTDAILEGHRALAHTISVSERRRIASDPTATQAYRERLIARVREIHPAIQAATLEAHLGADFMEMLFDAEEWTAGAAGACHPAAGPAPGPALAAQLNQILAPVARIVAAPGEGILAGVHLLTLPEVTQADVTHLQQAGVQTSIRAPLRSFKISDTPITIGLYHAVMGYYPDLSRSNYPTDQGERDALRARWQANPDLPLTNTTVAEDQAFIAALNTRTGRHFRLPTESEVEYSIRGRAQGAITTTRYHFGNDGNEVRNRAWVHSNSGNQAHGVREPLPGRTLDDSRNSFGLVHAIGNVWVRSAEGVVRGGSFNAGDDNAQSFVRGDGLGESRYAFIGARLVEDL